MDPTTNQEDSSITNMDVLDNAMYSPEDLEYLKAIEQEAALLFPPEKEYSTVGDLRNLLRLFASKKGFSIATDGCKILCSWSEEPTFNKNKREKKRAKQPIEKQRCD